MPFRIGRKFAQHTYPENTRAAAVEAFARNFVAGPDTPGLLLDNLLGSSIPWSTIAPPAGIGSPVGVDVPITPRSSGVVRVSGVVSISNASEVEEFLIVRLLVNTGSGPVLVPIPFLERVTVAAGGFAAIPILVDVPVPVGATSNFRVSLFPSTINELTVVTGSSTLDLQEVIAATG